MFEEGWKPGKKKIAILMTAFFLAGVLAGYFVYKMNVEEAVDRNNAVFVERRIGGQSEF